MSGTVSSTPTVPSEAAKVVAINDNAALYLTLADAIHGAAVGLSPAAQNILRRGLKDRFGPVFAARGDDAVDNLVRLAIEPRAA